MRLPLKDNSIFLSIGCRARGAARVKDGQGCRSSSGILFHPHGKAAEDTELAVAPGAPAMAANAALLRQAPATPADSDSFGCPHPALGVSIDSSPLPFSMVTAAGEHATSAREKRSYRPDCRL